MKLALLVAALWGTLAISQNRVVTVASSPSQMGSFQYVVFDQRDPLRPSELFRFESLEDFSEAPLLVVGNPDDPNTLVVAYLSPKTSGLITFSKANRRRIMQTSGVSAIGRADDDTVALIVRGGALMHWNRSNVIEVIAPIGAIPETENIQGIEQVAPQQYLILYKHWMDLVSFGAGKVKTHRTHFHSFPGFRATSFARQGSKIWIGFESNLFIAEFDLDPSIPVQVVSIATSHFQTYQGITLLPSVSGGLRLQVGNHLLDATFGLGGGTLKVHLPNVFGSHHFGLGGTSTQFRIRPFAIAPARAPLQANPTKAPFRPIHDQEMRALLDQSWMRWQASLHKPAAKMPDEITPGDLASFLNQVTAPDYLVVLKKVEPEALYDMGLEIRMGSAHPIAKPALKRIRSATVAVHLADGASKAPCSEALRKFLKP